MLLWIDGFDQYGGDEDAAIDGAWAEYVNFGKAATLVNNRSRTGNWSLRFPPTAQGPTSSINATWWRRVFRDNYKSVGVGFALWLDELPEFPRRIGLLLADEDNTPQCRFYVMPTGAIELMRGGSQDSTANGPIGTHIATSSVALTAGGWNHVEIFATIGTADGAAEVRVNGVTVLNVTGVNLQQSTKEHAAMLRIGELRRATGEGGMQAAWYVDDMFTWEPSGSYANDFIGDKKVYLSRPNADTAVEEWSPAVGDATYENLRQVPPQDGTYFITASGPGVTSVVEMEDLPAEVVSITAVQATVRAVKSDAGDARIRVGVVSGSDADESGDIPLNMTPTYYWAFFPEDPATGLPWTAYGFNASQASIERTV